jgi:hypothetical protein
MPPLNFGNTEARIRLRVNIRTTVPRLNPQTRLGSVSVGAHKRSNPTAAIYARRCRHSHDSNAILSCYIVRCCHLIATCTNVTAPRHAQCSFCRATAADAPLNDQVSCFAAPQERLRAHLAPLIDIGGAIVNYVDGTLFAKDSCGRLCFFCMFFVFGKKTMISR